MHLQAISSIQIPVGILQMKRPEKDRCQQVRFPRRSVIEEISENDLATLECASMDG